ncbi:hypothetical protein [Olleya marilimosa]|uniref:hypothetical protein n=1 Tax=Olleya marilimosa TaxID=272164 RepID=UPI0030ED6E05|tara:strand:- start:13550 stop:14272 length:723 start_codon:yes stop_codon:yes gene_type:complete
MAPNKFEKQLKDTLERRTIAPSKIAWSQLDTQLDVQKNKQKFPFWWFSIAATFLGVFLAIFVFNDKPDPINVVIEDVKNEILLPSEINQINKQNKLTKIITSPELVVDKVNVKPKNKAVTNKNKATIQSVQAEKSNVVLVVNDKIKPEDKATIASATNSEKPIDKTSQTTTITSEADLLLKEAYSDVQDNYNTYIPEKIDANSLLEDVEMKSEKSLKNRLFHAVKSGYETLKTTVAERDL